MVSKKPEVGLSTRVRTMVAAAGVVTFTAGAAATGVAAISAVVSATPVVTSIAAQPNSYF
jgi:hypothetical protein